MKIENMELIRIDENLYGSPTDYSDEKNWLSIPVATKEVDVFYLYPAAYLCPEGKNLPFSELHDENVASAARYFLKSQASVYSEACNVFTPFYRQIDPTIALRYVAADKLNLIADVWSRDIIDSFKHYMENINNGRGFILAGHSQGSRLLNILLSTYLKENRSAYEKMIAAYLIGDSVTEKYLKENPHLKFARGEDDLGVIISWNVEMNDISEKNPLLQDGAISINPINWKRDETHATAAENLGSVLKKDLISPGVADAKVNLQRGSVQCSSVSPDDFPPPMQIFPRGTYHSMDYGFYYQNLKANVKKRVNAYLNRK